MSKRALIIDDNTERTPGLQAAVRRHGYECTLVATGHAAIAALRDPYQLVLLDHDLWQGVPPEKLASARNGYHVALAIARTAHRPRPFVLMHTANASGAARMSDVFTRAGIAHAWLPFDVWSDAAFDRIVIEAPD